MNSLTSLMDVFVITMKYAGGRGGEVKFISCALPKKTIIAKGNGTAMHITSESFKYLSPCQRRPVSEAEEL